MAASSLVVIPISPSFHHLDPFFQYLRETPFGLMILMIMTLPSLMTIGKRDGLKILWIYSIYFSPAACEKDSGLNDWRLVQKFFEGILSFWWEQLASFTLIFPTHYGNQRSRACLTLRMWCTHSNQLPSSYRNCSLEKRKMRLCFQWMQVKVSYDDESEVTVRLLSPVREKRFVHYVVEEWRASHGLISIN